MRRIIHMLAIGLIMPVFVSQGGEEIRREHSALRGRWHRLRIEYRGRDASEDEVFMELTISAPGKAVLGHKVGETPLSYSIDPTATPKRIDFTFTREEGSTKGEELKLLGIYILDGAKLTLCLANSRSAEGERPKEFTTKSKDHVLIVLERVDE